MIKWNPESNFYPLLPMQEGMLFHSVSSPDGVYIGQVICRLDKNIDICAFEWAWQRVLARHEALRATFHVEEMNEPLQQIHSPVGFELSKEDWKHISADDQKRKLDTYLRGDRKNCFSLIEVPLMRFKLFELMDGDYWFVWTHHHALLDGRARVVVLKEVSIFYDSYLRGEDPQLPSAPSYRKYVEWFYEQEAVDAERYWSNVLKAFVPPPLLELGGEDQVESERYGIQPVLLPSDISTRLSAVARQQKATVNLIVQVAWALLLSQYTGQQDVVFGETRACRRPGFVGAASLVGVVMNTVPVRLQIHRAHSLSDLVKELKEQHVALKEYEYTSLVSTRAWSEVPGDRQLFESVIVFEEQELGSALRQQQCSIWNDGIRRFVPTHYPLTVVGYNKPELSLEIVYDRFVICGSAAHRMAEHLQGLIREITANAEAHLTDQLFVSPLDTMHIGEWNTTRRAYPCSSCVHQLVEQQANLTPDNTAV